MRILLSFLALMLAAPLAAETRVPQNQMEIQLGFAPLVKQATPAVVNIYARRVVQERFNPFQNDPFFRDMFRDFGRTRNSVQSSLGSGVILTDDGFAVSNYHVVGGATDIRVVLSDRRELSAKVVLSDEESDLAILKLETDEPLPYLSMRDSDGVEVGELVLAIGNPFGIGQTVSSGIVSGLARSGTATGNARGYFLQTDAPINPGNSGGALIDVNGALIGVNTSILTRSGGSNGIGFAIPTNLIREVLKQAQSGMSLVTRPWAGMSGQSLDREIAESLGLDRPVGIAISALHDQSPFRSAGIRPGDVILSVDGQDVNTPPEMIFRMTVAGLGNRVKVERFRAGKRDFVEVDLLPAPEVPTRDTIAFSRGDMVPGLVISRINPGVIAQFGLSFSASGVIVEDPGGAGRRLGLTFGDVIVEINGKPMKRPQDVARAFDGNTRVFALIFERHGKQQLLRFRM